MKRRILFVDDDKELSEEMADLLMAEGYSVQTAFDGLQAEKLINKHRYDVILLDLKMPVLSGTDLLNRLNRIGLKSKIILISGKPFLEKEIKKLGFLPMVSAFVSKPFDVKRLLHTITLT